MNRSEQVSDLEVVATWLSGLPTECVVRWGDGGMSEDHPVATDWVDVSVEAPNAPRWNWIWEIVDQLQEPEGPLTIVAEPDVRVGGRPGWTAPCVANILSRWTADHVGRADLVFEFDPEVGAAIVKQALANRRDYRSRRRRRAL